MVSTWSETWRHETEVACLLPLAKRNTFLDGVPSGTGDERGVKGVRGESAVAELRAAVERNARPREPRAPVLDWSARAPR
ncbi:DUF7696 family protein [Bosea vaviloviae]|uniref:DUF7696 family protein n=1 Tax=Bosea vaviloviae TaxID=1526658 RepID=UPI003CC7A05E